MHAQRRRLPSGRRAPTEWDNKPMSGAGRAEPTGFEPASSRFWRPRATTSALRLRPARHPSPYTTGTQLTQARTPSPGLLPFQRARQHAVTDLHTGRFPGLTAPHVLAGAARALCRPGSVGGFVTGGQAQRPTLPPKGSATPYRGRADVSERRRRPLRRGRTRGRCRARRAMSPERVGASHLR